jgi:hypothetical protein
VRRSAALNRLGWGLADSCWPRSLAGELSTIAVVVVVGLAANHGTCPAHWLQTRMDGLVHATATCVHTAMPG